MRSPHISLLLASLIVVATIHPHLAADEAKCTVTKPLEHPFVPPAPYSSSAGSNEFFYGTPALWTAIDPVWRVHSGGKLPFFRRGYDSTKEGRPQLAVVARRLDGEGPLVWNGLPGSGSVEGKGLAGMFMHRHPFLWLLGDRRSLHRRARRYSDTDLYRMGFKLTTTCAYDVRPTQAG